MSISLLPFNLKVEFAQVEENLWFLIRLDLYSSRNVGENFVIRNGGELHSNKRPLTINSSVFFNYMGSGAFGSVVYMSDDRKFLEAELHLLENEMARQAAAEVAQPDTTAGPSRIIQDHEDNDYSSSHSDWAPNANDDSSETGEEQPEKFNPKKVKLETYRRSKHKKRSKSGSVMRTPSLKADPVMPKATSIPNPGASHNTSWSHPAPVDKYSRRISRTSGHYRHSFPAHAYQQRRQPAIIESNFSIDNPNNVLTNDTVIAAISSIQNTVSKLVQELTDMKRELGFRTDLFPSSPSSGFSEQHVLGDMNHHYHQNTWSRRHHQQMEHPHGYGEVQSYVHGIENSNFTPGQAHYDHGHETEQASTGVYDFIDEDRPAQKPSKKVKRSKKESRRPPYLEEVPQQEQETVRTSSNSSSDNGGYGDMVPIGIGHTMIPKHVLNHIDWSSYTMATRKLLMAVFPRRTLATHSLTGKPSPAFAAKKPTKLALDTNKVNDIVITVVEKCRVKEGLVRSAITTKCADENKMYRVRQSKKEKNKKGAQEMHDQENLPPKGESPEEPPGIAQTPEAGCSRYSQ